MGKRNNQLKVLANIAKRRLMKGEYNEPEEKTFFVPKVSSYFIKNASAMKRLTAKIEYVKISSKINYDFERKVFQILDENFYDLNPFSKLVDFEIYNKLNDSEKQSYMLKIAEEYNYLKELYSKEKQAI